MSSLPDRPPPPGLVFRNWRSRDVEALCRHANNRNIWLNLLDRFPHPYTRRDAERWIDLNNATLSPPVNFAIELDGEAIGGVGMDRRQDVHRGTAEIGYWVAEPFWGRGIATAAARFIADYAFRAYPLVRLEAAGVRVEPRLGARAGEGRLPRWRARLRQAVTKDGRVGDRAAVRPLPGRRAAGQPRLIPGSWRRSPPPPGPPPPHHPLEHDVPARSPPGLVGGVLPVADAARRRGGAGSAGAGTPPASGSPFQIRPSRRLSAAPACSFSENPIITPSRKRRRSRSPGMPWAWRCSRHSRSPVSTR